MYPLRFHGKRIVLAGGVRTPWGHINKSLAGLSAARLATITLQELLKRSGIDPGLVDSVILGWVGQGTSAPNIARIAGVTAGLPVSSVAYTLHVNCVAGMESVCSAVRHILSGEGEIIIAGGTESMSNLPYVIRGVRQHAGLRTISDLRNKWKVLIDDPDLKLGDARQESIYDPICDMIQSETAEVLAQIYDISREEQDRYALRSYRKAIAALQSGRFDGYVFPVVHEGDVLLRHDENPVLRKKLVESPENIGKSRFLFSNSDTTFEDFYHKNEKYLMGRPFEEGLSRPTLTPFNACPMTDGSAAVIVTTEDRARENGLDIMACIEGWAYAGVEPAHMGIGPVHAVEKALRKTGFSFNDMDAIQLHEAFAATCLAVLKVGEKEYGHEWRRADSEGILNPDGGSLALGHPLAATGTRLLLNLADDIRRSPGKRLGMAAACASGGIAGCMILSRYDG